jgi:hypothetical protein
LDIRSAMGQLLLVAREDLFNLGAFLSELCFESSVSSSEVVQRSRLVKGSLDLSELFSVLQ